MLVVASHDVAAYSPTSAAAASEMPPLRSLWLPSAGLRRSTPEFARSFRQVHRLAPRPTALLLRHSSPHTRLPAPPRSLDNSEAAALSCDFHLSGRWQFQREVLSCLAKVALQQQLADADPGTPPRHGYAVVSAGGRPAVLVPPTSDALHLYSRLADVPCQGELQLVTALKLALVSLTLLSGVVLWTCMCVCPCVLVLACGALFLTPP